MIRRLLPHIRNFVHVRQAVAGARALGPSPLHLFANARLGVIHLDRHGRIAQANGRAGDLLTGGNALRQEEGFLRARRPDDDTASSAWWRRPCRPSTRRGPAAPCWSGSLPRGRR